MCWLGTLHHVLSCVYPDEHHVTDSCQPAQLRRSEAISPRSEMHTPPHMQSKKNQVLHFTDSTEDNAKATRPCDLKAAALSPTCSTASLSPPRHTLSHSTRFPPRPLTSRRAPFRHVALSSTTLSPQRTRMSSSASSANDARSLSCNRALIQFSSSSTLKNLQILANPGFAGTRDFQNFSCGLLMGTYDNSSARALEPKL